MNSTATHNRFFIAALMLCLLCTKATQAQTTWTSQNAAVANNWYSVTYGNGVFVAVSEDGTNRVMTSPNAVLPIELLDFTGKNKEGGNLLS